MNENSIAVNGPGTPGVTNTNNNNSNSEARTTVSAQQTAEVQVAEKGGEGAQAGMETGTGRPAVGPYLDKTEEARQAVGPYQDKTEKINPAVGPYLEQEREKKGGGGYRRNGNVARLPRAVRTKINEMIQDGVTYAGIIESLGKDGEGLDISNLSRWKDGGYQDWLAEQAFIERTRARQEAAGDLARDMDATEVNHAALQLGALHIYEALRDLGPESLDKKLGGDCGAFARLLNALARASRETMQLQRYREDCAKARAALKPMLDPKRKLTQSENRAIAEKVSTLLGLDRELKPEEITFTYGRKLPGKEIEMFGVSTPIEGPNGSTSSPASTSPNGQTPSPVPPNQ